jgi:hypothetical protein
MSRSVRSLLPLTCATLLGCADSPSGPPPTATCAVPVALRVGEVREFSGSASLSCLVVASADVPSELLFVTANATPSQDDLREYLVRATTGTSVASTVAGMATATAVPPADVTRRSIPSDRLGTIDPVFASEVERSVRTAERRLLGNRSIAALAADANQERRVEGAAAFPAATGATSTRAPVVGDTLLLRVGNAARTDLCSNYTAVRAVVKALGRYATIALDVGAPSGGFTDADFQALAQDFDAVTFPTVSAWFGAPTDINRDGRITILFTPEINRLTPTGSLGFAGGFFFMGDLLARSIPSQNYRCDASNEQEILYLLTPDPNGQVNGNRFPVETARESARGTMAHEVQHMINQGVRQSANAAAALEVSWLNEGLSHFAEEVVGRASRGYSDLQRLDWDNVLVDLDDFDSYFRQNLLRFRFWLDRPDLSSPISTRAASELAPRGAAWALVRFAIDQHGRSNPRAFTRALVAGPQIDVANLAARTGVPFERLLPGFLMASYGDVADVGAAYRYASWDMRDVMQTLNGGVYPLRLAALPTDALARSLSGSGNYFFVSRAARAEPTTFRMLSPDGSPITFPGARVYVVRLR